MVGKFDSLNADMDKILNKLISSQEICKLLSYNTVSPSPLLQPNVNNPSKLIYDKIFPYRFNIDENTEASSFITVVFSNYKLTNNCFKAGKVLFNIIVHKDLIKVELESGANGMRYYCMANLIDSIFNNQNIIGTMNLKFSDFGEIYMNKNYTGIGLAYEISQFN